MLFLLPVCTIIFFNIFLCFRKTNWPNIVSCVNHLVFVRPLDVCTKNEVWLHMIHWDIISFYRTSFSNTFLKFHFFSLFYCLVFITLFGWYFGWFMIFLTVNTCSNSDDSLRIWTPVSNSPHTITKSSGSPRVKTGSPVQNGLSLSAPWQTMIIFAQNF